MTSEHPGAFPPLSSILSTALCPQGCSPRVTGWPQFQALYSKLAASPVRKGDHPSPRVSRESRNHSQKPPVDILLHHSQNWSQSQTYINIVHRGSELTPCCILGWGQPPLRHVTWERAWIPKQHVSSARKREGRKWMLDGPSIMSANFPTLK